MAKMNGVLKFGVDLEATVTLRPEADGAETPAVNATVNENALALNALNGAYWQTDGELADKQIAVVIHVSAMTTAGGETYTMSIQFDDSAAFTSGVTHATFTLTAPGYYVFYFDMDTVTALDATKKPTHVRTSFSTGGAGVPSLDYWAWMVAIPAIG